MSSEIYKVTQIVGHQDGDTATIGDMTKLITELNKALAEVGVALGRVNGRDGAITKFANDLDMDNHSINSVAAINFGPRKHATGNQPFTGKYSVDDPVAIPLTIVELRDDLADNVLPDITIALNDLGAQVRRILDVLKL